MVLVHEASVYKEAQYLPEQEIWRYLQLLPPLDKPPRGRFTADMLQGDHACPESFQANFFWTATLS